MPSTWTIHDKDGGYLGESKAMSAKVAFILYLSEQGRSAGLADVKTELLPDGRTRIVHHDKVHFLKRSEK